MDNKCEKCGGELVEGKLGGMYLTCFYPKGEEKRLSPKKQVRWYAPAVKPAD